MARSVNARPFLASVAARLLAGALVLSPLGPMACRGDPTYDYTKEPDPRRGEYTIGPLDQLSVVVWKNRELSADVTVRPDGTITLPLVGDVKVEGRTPSQVQKELTRRYSEYLKVEDGTVSVGVSQVNSYSFTVSGNVERPGYFTSKTYLSAVEALALAGGPNRYAGDEFYIIRGSPARRIPISLKRATSGEHPAENVMVLRGDLIVVP